MTMRIRSAVSVLGVTLALAVMLTTTTTPAFAAKSNAEQTMPSSVADTKSTKQKVDPAKSRSVSNATSSKQQSEEPYPGSSSRSSPDTSSSTVNTGPTYQQGPASAATVGITVPGIPAGSVVPAGVAAQMYQQGPGPAVGTASTGPINQQGSGPVAGAVPSGPINQQGPAPLFQGPVPGVGAGSTGVAHQQGPVSTSSSVDPSQQPGARPDVRVVYVNSASNNSSTLYHFRVENLSSQLATGINLSSVVREQSATSHASRRVEERYAPIGSLAAGQYQDVVVTCTPQSGFQCVNGALDAYVANDLSPANNTAHS